MDILKFPDPRLKNVASEVMEINEDIQNIVDRMFATMYAANGIGLAAIQVAIDKRIIVIDESVDRRQPICLINPKVTAEGEQIVSEEGCLSFPNIYVKVKRAKQVEISYLDRGGVSQSLRADDLLSRCIQHEIDHLNGITFFDHLSPLKQSMLRKKLKKLQDK